MRVEQHLSSGKPFDRRSTDLWTDVTDIFRAIREGHVEWTIPEYDGGMFEDSAGADDEAREAAQLLAEIEIANAELAPLLVALAFDEEDGPRGKIDFGDLGVRYLGTLYEGLLSFEALFAEADLVAVGDEFADASGRIPTVRAGEPYVVSPRGGRKASGTYFTPPFVVRRLIDEALKPTLRSHLERVAEAPIGERWERMLDFRVVDPAMGSAHFLVDALDAIAEGFLDFLREQPSMPATPLNEARRYITELGQAHGIEALGEAVGDFDLVRRIVLKHCIYGIDLQPMAVELARLGLWLHAFVPGMALAFLGHSLRVGNSLVGVVGDEIQEALGDRMFWPAIKAQIEDALAPAERVAESQDRSLEEVSASRQAQRDLDAATATLKGAFNVYACRMFAGEAGKQVQHSDLLGSLAKGQIPSEYADGVSSAEAIGSRLRALHWQLAFPEVFLRERPGFDVVLGNPPWEEVTVERLGFFTRFIPGIKSIAPQSRQEALITAYEQRHADVADRFQTERERVAELRVVIGEAFTLQRGGDPDLYKAFAELALRLSRAGGAIGMVYPRTLLANYGLAPFRERLFPIAEITADFATNTGGWVFPEAEPRYTIVALAARKTRRSGLREAGPVVGQKAWSAMPDARIEWSLDDLRKASSGLEVPLIPDERSAVLFRRVVREGRRFDATLDRARFTPWAPLHGTNDRKSGLLREKGSGWPVYGGDNFTLWDPERGKPPFVLSERKGIEVLQRKRLRSRGTTWRGLAPQVLADRKSLPQYGAHILFRDVARATDSRTIIAALVPARRFSTNKAPLLVQVGGNELDTAYRLAVMCSLTFDWCARRRVETNVNFFILEALPVPARTLDDPLAARAATIAARLACVDERFSDFATACGVPTGMLDPETRADAIAELDAAVAALYGLSDEDLDIVLGDFTRDAVPDARRDATRRHLSALRGPLTA